MSNVIIHEYHYPGGPQTFEYSIGSVIPKEHLKCMSPFVQDIASRTAKSILEYFEVRWGDIHPVAEPISKYLLSMRVVSVALTESSDGISSSWLIFRDLEGGQCLLGSSPAPTQEILTADWIDDVSGLRCLLAEFGNLQVGMIPPCMGFHSGGGLIRESDDELCWGSTGKWENALPIYHDGSGSLICVSTDGEVGIWSLSQFQDVTPSLSEFVTMFVRNQRSRQSPKGEWWW